MGVRIFNKEIFLNNVIIFVLFIYFIICFYSLYLILFCLGELCWFIGFLLKKINGIRDVDDRRCF